MTTFHYNLTTPIGRGIAHLFAASSLGHYVDGAIEIYEHTGGGRTATVAQELEDAVSDGEAALLLVVGSLAGTAAVNLSLAFDALDEWNRQVIIEAAAMAAGVAEIQVGAL